MSADREVVVQAATPLGDGNQAEGVFVLSLQQLEAQRLAVANAVWNLAANTQCADSSQVDSLLKAIPLPQAPAFAGWRQPAEQPVVALGNELHCFIALKSKLDGKVRVATMHYVNKPVQSDEGGDYPDWALWNDGDPVGIVGWAEKTNHSGYSDYFEPFTPENTEIVGWQPVPYPVAPALGEGGDLLTTRGAPVDQKQIGSYRKFEVCRTDGRDQPGGDRAGAKYFVLDATYDKYAKAALAAYVASCRADYPMLADDMEKQFELSSALAARSFVQEVPDHCDRIIWKNRYFHLPLAAPLPDAAVAAIKYALQAEREDGSGIDFLREWNEGGFVEIRRDWEGVPEAVFIGADPLHPQTASVLARGYDSDLLDWLESHATVGFSFAVASITFGVPESFKGSNSIRDLVGVAMTAKDDQS